MSEVEKWTQLKNMNEAEDWKIEIERIVENEEGKEPQND